MIQLTNVTMNYPVPKRYVEYLTHPFRKRYFTALHGVSARFERGESVAILGPNGAGKTTLLKLIGGLLYPSSGEVALNGHRVSTDSHYARSLVGYVLNEERSFYWRLTGFENLDFFGALDELPRRVRRARIHKLMGFVGLSGATDVRVSDYSCGMRQRLAIARGLLSDPKVLILDEPTKSLDPLGAERLREFICERLGAGDRTLLVATHQTAEAETMCDTVYVLQGGRIRDSAAMGDIFRDHGGVGNFYRATVDDGSVEDVGAKSSGLSQAGLPD